MNKDIELSLLIRNYFDRSPIVLDNNYYYDAGNLISKNFVSLRTRYPFLQFRTHLIKWTFLSILEIARVLDIIPNPIPKNTSNSVRISIADTSFHGFFTHHWQSPLILRLESIINDITPTDTLGVRIDVDQSFHAIFSDFLDLYNTMACNYETQLFFWLFTKENYTFLFDEIDANNFFGRHNEQQSLDNTEKLTGDINLGLWYIIEYITNLTRIFDRLDDRPDFQDLFRNFHYPMFYQQGEVLLALIKEFVEDIRTFRESIDSPDSTTNEKYGSEDNEETFSELMSTIYQVLGEPDRKIVNVI